MVTLNVMKLNFTYKMTLRGFNYIHVDRKWNGVDVLTMEINSQVTNADLIEVDDVMWLNQELHKGFVVERIEEVLQGNTINYEITAVSINSLLRDYITVPPNGGYHSVTGTRETIVRTWVDANCINPIETSRKQYPIVLGTIKGIGSSLTDQTRYKVLTDEISRVLLTEDLGYGLEIDIANKRFVFNVYEGVNRTSLQSVNPRVLFGLKYGNIADYKKVKDTTGTKNVIYVAGQGEGADRTIVKVTGLGTRKKETFVDARDTDLLNELTERGNQKLTELSEINNYEFETIERQFKYGIDYELGDYVTVVLDKDNIQHLQLQKVKEVYEAGKISIVPEFGKPEKTITSVVQSTSKRIASLETELSGGGSTDVVGIGLNYAWNGTELGIKREDEASYTYADLEGPIGPQGKIGPRGLPGESLEFIWDGTQLGVKVEGDAYYQYIDLKGEAGTPGTNLNLKVSRQYDTYEDLPTNPDIGYMCLVGSDLYIFADNGWVNAGKLTDIDLDIYTNIDGGLFTDGYGVIIGESALEALQDHTTDDDTHVNLIIDGMEV